MADETLEQRVDNAAQPEKKEEPKISGLQNMFNETSDALRFIGNTAITAGAIGAATYFYNIGGLITAGAFTAARKIGNDLRGIETKIKDLRDASIIGAGFTPALYTGVEIFKQIPKVFGLDRIVTNIASYSVPWVSSLAATGLTFAILNPLLTALYHPWSYIVTNKKISGVVKDFKDNYIKSLKNTWDVNAFLSIATGVAYATALPTLYLLLVYALGTIWYALKLSKGEGKTEYKRLFSTVVEPFKYPFRLIEGTGYFFKRVTTSWAYSFGDGLRKLLTPKSAPTGPAPQLATAGAQA